ncbi:MAG: hypothetical protein Q9160_001372 [Pyrenula sp. 1 TL-2023]
MASPPLSCPLCFLIQDARSPQCLNSKCRNAVPNTFRLWEGQHRYVGFFRGDFESDHLRLSYRPTTTAPYVVPGQAAPNVQWMPGYPMGFVDPRYAPAPMGVPGGTIPQAAEQPQPGGRSHSEGQSESSNPEPPRSSRKKQKPRRGRGGRRFQRNRSKIGGRNRVTGTGTIRRPSARGRDRSRSPRRESSSPALNVRSKEAEDAREAAKVIQSDLRKAIKDRDAFKKKADDLEKKLKKAEQERDGFKADRAAFVQDVRSLLPR